MEMENLMLRKKKDLFKSLAVGQLLSQKARKV